MSKKLSSLTPILTGLVVATATTSLPSHAQEQVRNRFFCGSSNNIPTTLARTPRGNIAVIRWTSDYFSGSGWTPQRRCEEVSSRFQNYYSKGQLQFLTTGEMNRQQVICVTDREKADCRGLLLTLKRTTDPGQVLTSLLAVRRRPRTNMR